MRILSLTIADKQNNCCFSCERLEALKQSGTLRAVINEGNLVPGGCCPIVSSQGSLCGGKLILLRSKWGKYFVGCTKYPACALAGIEESKAFGTSPDWKGIEQARARVQAWFRGRSTLHRRWSQESSPSISLMASGESPTSSREPIPPMSSREQEGNQVDSHEPRTAMEQESEIRWEPGEATTHVIFAQESGRSVTISPHYTGDPALCHRWHLAGGSAKRVRYQCAYGKVKSIVRALPCVFSLN